MSQETPQPTPQAPAPTKKPNIFKRVGRLVASTSKFAYRSAKNTVFAVGTYSILNYYWKLKQRRQQEKATSDGSPITLTLDLNKIAVRGFTRQPFSIGNTTITIRELVEGLEAAAADSKVTGLIAHVGEGFATDLATVQEIREAVSKFAKKKQAKIFYTGTTVPFYLASAFPNVVATPYNGVGLTGLRVTSLFFKDLMHNIGLSVQVIKREGYKTAPNSLVNAEYTAEEKEQTESILKSFSEQIVAGIAKDNQKTEAEVARWFREGPFLDQEALELGLVDKFDFYNKTAEKEAAPKNSFMKLNKYARARISAANLAQPDRKGQADPKSLLSSAVAAIGGEKKELTDVAKKEVEKEEKKKATIGVVDFSGDVSPQSYSLRKVLRGLRQARANAQVKAVVLRIDTPGGAAYPAEEIRQSIEATQKAGKPVIVSMGSVAASAGYWMASQGTTIVANPATLTGSIGVFTMGASYGTLFARLGINEGHIETSPNARYLHAAGYAPWTEEQRAFYEKTVDSHYQSFLAIVAKNRKWTPEHARDLAGGRVYTGAQAKEKGLVDELGGYGHALTLAKAKTGADTFQVIDLGRDTLWKSLKRQIFSSGAPIEGKTMLEAFRAGLFGETIQVLAQELLGVSPVKSAAPQMKLTTIPKVE